MTFVMQILNPEVHCYHPAGGQSVPHNCMHDMQQYWLQFTAGDTDTVISKI